MGVLLRHPVTHRGSAGVGSGVAVREDRLVAVDQVDLTIPPKSPHPTNRGIFYVNSNTNMRDISDGTTNVLLVGEVQRLNDDPTLLTPPTGITTSSDGWAWGGAATLFATTLGINKPQFDNPGGPHPQMAQFCFADGSCRPINENIDLPTFQNLGNMASGIPVSEF